MGFTMKICPCCQKEYDDSTSFCGKCGSQLIEVQSKEQTPDLPSINTSEKKKTIIASIVTVIIIISIFCIASFFNNDTPSGGDDFYYQDGEESVIDTTDSDYYESDTSEYETDDQNIEPTSFKNETTKKETTTKKEITTKKETTTQNETTTETTTKSENSSVYLEATPDELNNLQQFLNSTAYTKGSLCTSYSSDNISYKQFVDNYLFFTSGDSFVYGKYFNAPIYNYEDTPDPLNRFMAINDDWNVGQYFKYSKANIDWIMKNIYNIPSSVISSFSASALEDEDTYFHDGYIYQEKHTGFGGGGCYIEVSSYNHLEDGKYSVSFLEVDGFSGSVVESATAIVSMKNIGGIRYWTLHFIH